MFAYKNMGFKRPKKVTIGPLFKTALSSLILLITSNVSANATVTGVLQLDALIPQTSTGATVHVTHANDGSNRLFYADLITGDINIYDQNTGQVAADPFLTVPDLGPGFSQGLYNVAFAPDYSSSGLFYVSFVNASDQLQIVEYSVSASDPNQADPNSARTILSIQHPNDGIEGHYGGWIGFGPNDGNLYVTSGDSDGFSTVSQDNSNLLGTVLRIDPRADDFPDDPERNYAIPADNPFVGTAGRDEIFANGLRNSFRAGFDSETGDFFVGDVGENRFEEINLIVNGGNYGWAGREGPAEFDLSLVPGGVLGTTLDPLFFYDHDSFDTSLNYSVTGGFVYHGDIAELDGHYVFGDFEQGLVLSFLWDSATQTTGELHIWELASDFASRLAISSFGSDDEGNLFLSDLFGRGIFQITSASITGAVSAVPLPAAWVFMLAGIGLFGSFNRKPWLSHLKYQ